MSILETTMEYQLLLLLHLLIGGYWLGGDIGVFYIAGKIADPAQPLPVRLFSAKAMMLLDMIPRTCLIMAFGTGLTVATLTDLLPLQGWLWLVWLVTLAWLALAWAAFVKEHSAAGHRIARIDFYLRLLVLVGCVAAGIDAFADGGVIAQSRWLGAKLILFAGIISMGLLVRIQLRPFGPLFGKVVTGTATDADQQSLKQLVARVKLPVLCIWMIILAIMVLGKLKPF
ncbi:hypothetical protein [Stenotrophomonas humi]